MRLTAIVYVLALLIGLTKVSFADEDPMIEIGDKTEQAMSFAPIGEQKIDSTTHTITPVTEKVVLLTEIATGKTTLVGLNKDKKQAILDVIVAAQLPAFGGIASVELLKTLEIGIEAGVGFGTYYGAFTNLHIIKFKAFDVSNDIYFGAHYRQRDIATDCAILVECYGSLRGQYGDIRIGLRQTGIDGDDRMFIAYEVGYGKFLNGGGAYTQKYDDYAPHGHHTGDTVEKQGLVLRVVIGYRLFSK